MSNMDHNKCHVAEVCHCHPATPSVTWELREGGHSSGWAMREPGPTLHQHHGAETVSTPFYFTNPVFASNHYLWGLLYESLFWDLQSFSAIPYHCPGCRGCCFLLALSLLMLYYEAKMYCTCLKSLDLLGPMWSLFLLTRAKLKNIIC